MTMTSEFYVDPSEFLGKEEETYEISGRVIVVNKDTGQVRELSPSQRGDTRGLATSRR